MPIRNAASLPTSTNVTPNRRRDTAQNISTNIGTIPESPSIKIEQQDWQNSNEHSIEETERSDLKINEGSFKVNMRDIQEKTTPAARAETQEFTPTSLSA
jgi:hypothetical protein